MLDLNELNNAIQMQFIRCAIAYKYEDNKLIEIGILGTDKQTLYTKGALIRRLELYIPVEIYDTNEIILETLMPALEKARAHAEANPIRGRAHEC